MIHPNVQIRDSLRPGQEVANASRSYVELLVKDIAAAPP